MRVPSDRPCKNGGYLHPVGDAPRQFVRREPPPRPAINAPQLWSDWCEKTPRSCLEDFASTLAVSVESLIALGCAWAVEHMAWCFPMRDGYGEIIGLRLRSDFGSKWAVTGSRQGIFIPNVGCESIGYITEGPTDTAAGVTLGLFTIGRPSCTGCTIQTETALRQRGIKTAVIVSDNDGPGFQGSKFLAAQLSIPSCILVLPCKDLRQFIQQGGDSVLVQSLVSSLVWSVPCPVP